MVVQVGVTNPVRGMDTVAVVPFFNQSSERAVDGRQIAILYATELQKVPGVEVIPVGVVETAMRELNLEDLSSPRDAVKLAAALHADAVVVGTITEYSPYYPPRLGMSVAWYTPYGMQFDPGVSVDDDARRRIHRDLFQRRKAKFNFHKDRVIGGIERHLDDFFLFEAGESQGPELPPGPSCPPSAKTVPPVPPVPPAPLPARVPAQSRFRPPIIIRSQSPGEAQPRLLNPQGGRPLEGGASRHGVVPREGVLPVRPLMSYTKLFDAADSETAAAYRDFVELRSDERGGNWLARLEWADEFPRFAAHRMIVEMFQIHGGQARRRVILKWRKHQ